MAAKKKNNRLRRGDSAYYRELQKASARATVRRHITVEVKREKREIVEIPRRSRSTDAGYDLSAAERVVIHAGARVMIPTGVRVCAPDGYAYFITGRSSMNRAGIEHPLGVIDAGYTGELFVTLYNSTRKDYVVKAGDRIAQIVFFPIIHAKMEEVETFSDEKARGDLGWGSSGK